MNKSNPKKLNRFTSVMYMLDMLERKKLYFPNYNDWMDKNDVSILDFYKEISDYKTLKILCFTHESETIHHWSNLSNSDSVCCIEFNYRKLIEYVKKEINDFQEGYVKYYPIKKLNGKTDLEQKDYLFAKRQPYKIENEYRIIFRSKDEKSNFTEININYDCINKITLNSSVPESINLLIAKIIGTTNIELNNSTIIKNVEWIDKMKGKYNKKLKTRIKKNWVV